ncbi:Sterol O-acyltransferase [Pelomyxa schiedti]|nr:Sterol O-acyltransferase [Pelomyxa schiedti]
MKKQSRNQPKEGSSTPATEAKDATKSVDARSSKIDGARNLVFVLGLNYLITTFTLNYLAGRRIIDTRLLVTGFLSVDFLILVCWFLLVEIFLSFTAWGLIAIFQIHKLPKFWSGLIHYGHLSILFGSTMYVCLCWKLAFTPRTAGFVEMLVLCLKMHSFVHYHRHTVPTPSPPTFWQYFEYLLFPTLIYQPSYPRTSHIDWRYMIQQLVLCVGTLTVLYVLTTEVIAPVLEQAIVSPPLESVMKLLIPFLLGYLLMWFMVFDIILTGFAEISRFKPREFYLDWWNSTTFSEYNRRWNKPVHEWLTKYVYIEVQNSWGCSKIVAGLCTFFVSAIAHELFFIVTFRIVRMYWLTLMMLQMPLYILGEGLRDTKLGNFIFWQGIVIGIPMQVVMYAREAFGGYSMFWTLQFPCICIASSAALLGGVLMLFSNNHKKRV